LCKDEVKCLFAGSIESQTGEINIHTGKKMILLAKNETCFYKPFPLGMGFAGISF